MGKEKIIAVKIMDQEGAEKLFNTFVDDLKKMILAVNLKRSTEPITDYAIKLVEIVDEAIQGGILAGADAQKHKIINDMPIPVVKKGGLVN